MVYWSFCISSCLFACMLLSLRCYFGVSVWLMVWLITVLRLLGVGFDIIDLFVIGFGWVICVLMFACCCVFWSRLCGWFYWLCCESLFCLFTLIWSWRTIVV